MHCLFNFKLSNIRPRGVNFKNNHLILHVLPVFSRVPPIEPHNNNNKKTCKKNRCPAVLSLTKTGPGTWTWSPGAALLAAHCSWLSLGEDARMGEMQKINSTLTLTLTLTRLLTACVRVCVLCVTTHLVCRLVHAVWPNKRTCPLIITTYKCGA